MNIDGIILIAIIVPAIICVCWFIMHVLSSPGGSKGITAPYTTKSGVERTAHKSRENYIV